MVKTDPRQLTSPATFTSKKEVVYSIITALISITVLEGCNATVNIDAFDPVGRWTERNGFSVSLFPDGKFEFCDNEKCATGTYVRPYGLESYAVVLKNFFKLENSARLQSLINEYDPDLKIDHFPDLDFSVNYGILPEDPPLKYCDKKPCIIFGAVDRSYDERRLVFERMDFK